jgi:hypothetical protein
MSGRSQLKGAKKSRSKHSKLGQRGSKPQLHPDDPFIKPLKKAHVRHKKEAAEPPPESPAAT